MTRIVLRGGQVFDGTGVDPAPADVAVIRTAFTGLPVIHESAEGDWAAICLRA